MFSAACAHSSTTEELYREPMPRTVRSSASVTYVAGMISFLIKIEGAKGYKAPSTRLLVAN
jgi:hypothetical protein